MPSYDAGYLTRMLALSMLLLLLSPSASIIPCCAVASAETSVVMQTSIKESSHYYKLLTAQDSSIFAGSCSIVGSGDNDFSGYNYVAGVRTRFNISTAATWLRTSSLPNTRDTAYRAGVLSDLMVSMAVMYLEATNELPFGRTGSISSTYLPSTYTSHPFLVNPGFPSVPITLNMLLMHTSSITETNFSFGAAEAPGGTAPTLDTFVSSILSPSNGIFSLTTQPGLDSSYSYSRTNTAIASYVIERVLAASTSYSTLSGISEFVFSIILAPLSLTNTFLLHRDGRYAHSTCPPTSNSCTDMRSFKAIQDVNTEGTKIQATYPIHASYFSDYMLYTTTADLVRLAKEVFLPDGFYYAAIGARMLATSQKVTATALPYITGRTPGLFRFDPNLLCETMYKAVKDPSELPPCHVEGTLISPDAAAFGMVATGGNTQVALICLPLVSNQTYCAVAALSFSTSSIWPSANSATGGSMAVGLAMASIPHLVREPYLTIMATPAPQLNGWFIFVGVVASLAVVVFAAFVADYFIQPAPPAKIIAPVMAGSGMGMRIGTARTEDVHAASNGRGGMGSAAELTDYESPKNPRDTATSSSLTNSSSRPHRPRPSGRHRRGGMDSDDEENGDGDVNYETPYLLRSANRRGGGGDESLLRRRHHNRYDNGEGSSDDGSHSSPDDAWGGHEVEMAERASTGSQRPHPKGMLRFDAYI
ncbi:hypothetical protein ABL78_7618 [Leptomonas seymouri]|uniref:Beta-lactamase-related domain-containing protein n=1 Tax=Leptomonas seymouri TaxID=5684 RepID=A0A0N1HZA5_LEPSE|nr:hypothetical protein ABL78_7618 [Leptomonas seymouri]|eukprot:KPI83350.1 hypothetical protein ABL78_7618 [Leptomonas seymouri]